MRALIAFLLLASPALARDPVLAPPIDCVLGQTCYIQNYVDTDPGPGAADFTCGTLSYDGHTGTDFALPTLLDMQQGVDVLASAPGTVKAIRDGMADIAQNTEGAPDITGRECGNGVVIDHGDGWRSQYCHMKQGSIAVQKGQRVGASTVLGQVGLSGQTEFPHVHLALRHNGKLVDPFNPSGLIFCGEDAMQNGTLWDRDMLYHVGGLLTLGLATEIPTYDDVTSGTVGIEGGAHLTSESPALVVFGFGYGALKSDIVRLSIFGPDGEVISHDAILEDNQARMYRAVGRKNPGTWALGGYTATVQLMRNGIEIDRREERFRIDK
ncbi:M23 family metallopeptidase [Celeribacter sp. ULVN23_4]